jgi:fluoride exporter
MSYLWIALGGALGSVARFWLWGVVTNRAGDMFPWGTIIVNVTGSFAIGTLAAISGPEGRWPGSPFIRQFLMVGICGGYTTFSSFSLQTLDLMRDGEYAHACANVLLSVALCLLGVWLGHRLGMSMLSRP